MSDSCKSITLHPKFLIDTIIFYIEEKYHKEELCPHCNQQMEIEYKHFVIQTGKVTSMMILMFKHEETFYYAIDSETSMHKMILEKNCFKTKAEASKWITT